MKKFLIERPRRNRRSAAIRALTRETRLTPDCLVAPVFVAEGRGRKTPVKSMPGVFRFSLDLALREIAELKRLGVRAVALFPVIPERLKDKRATESANDRGLYAEAIRAVKARVSGMAVIADVAMDPYSSDGHDGLVGKNGKILNDETLEILKAQALTQARAGADFIAPSDMMDGRVAAIRSALDGAGFTDTGILAYSAKYASSFYGPFRDALSSAPKKGDKKTYQMDPANAKEALREAKLDVREGADIVMVKPGLAYLDVVSAVSRAVAVPVAVYNVSGEYAMVKAAAAQGWVDEEAAVLEILTAFRRAGATLILTYHAKDAAFWLSKNRSRR